MTTKQSLVKALRENVIHIPLLISLFCVAEMNDALRTWYSWVGIFTTAAAYCVYISRMYKLSEQLAWETANLKEALKVREQLLTLEQKMIENKMIEQKVGAELKEIGATLKK